MIQSFRGRGTEDIFNGRDTREARSPYPQILWRAAFRKLDQLDSAAALDDLRSPPGNRLEALQADREGQFSTRVNQQYVWTESGPDQVEIVGYH